VRIKLLRRWVALRFFYLAMWVSPAEIEKSAPEETQT
jgi:hypothetical protein